MFTRLGDGVPGLLTEEKLKRVRLPTSCSSQTEDLGVTKCQLTMYALDVQKNHYLSSTDQSDPIKLQISVLPTTF